MQFRTIKELRSTAEKALITELKDARKYKNALLFERAQGSLKDSSQVKKTKKHMARIYTLFQERAYKKTINN